MRSPCTLPLLVYPPLEKGDSKGEPFLFIIAPINISSTCATQVFTFSTVKSGAMIAMQAQVRCWFVRKRSLLEKKAPRTFLTQCKEVGCESVESTMRFVDNMLRDLTTPAPLTKHLGGGLASPGHANVQPSQDIDTCILGLPELESSPELQEQLHTAMYQSENLKDLDDMENQIDSAFTIESRAPLAAAEADGLVELCGYLMPDSHRVVHPFEVESSTTNLKKNGKPEEFSSASNDAQTSEFVSTRSHLSDPVDSHEVRCLFPNL